MTSKSKTFDGIIVLFLLLIFFGLYPFEVSNVLFGGVGIKISMLLMGILFILAALRNRMRLRLPQKDFSIVTLIMISYFLLWGAFQGSRYVLFNAYYFFLGYLLVVIILNLIDFHKVGLALTRFTVFSGIMTVIGVVLFSMGMLSVVSIFENPVGYTIVNYGFFFVKVLPDIDITSLQFLRPSGYFDEPGSFAYVSMLMLFVNKAYVRNKWLEVLIIVLPIVTTSLAHILVSFLYILLMYGNRKNLKYVILFIILGGILVFLLEYLAERNEFMNYIYRRIFARGERISGGDMADPRTVAMKMAPQLIAEHPFGVSMETIRAEVPDYSFENIYSVPLIYGIQGILMYFLPFVYVLLRLVKKGSSDRGMLLKFLFIWCVSIIQRPFYIQPFYIMIFYFLFFWQGKFEIRTKRQENIADQRE